MVEKIKNKIDNRQNLFRSLAVCITVCFVLYIYFVTHTVYSVVERGHAEKAIAALDGSMSDLESQYAALESGITAELAAEKGFVAIASAEFISRNSSGNGLSLNTGL